MAKRRISLKALSALLLLLCGAGTALTLLLYYSAVPHGASSWRRAFLSALRLPRKPWAPRQDAPLWGYISVPDAKPLQLHCRECALVSSSGQMLGTGAGPDIDSTECVWRMNNAVLGPQYRADVGARSTVRVVSHTSVPLLAKRATSFFSNGSDNTQGNATYVIWGPLKNMRRSPPARVYSQVLALKGRFPWASIFTLTDEQMQRCDEVFKNETGKDRLKSGAYLSTGWFTMVLAMEVCDSIHVYGMIDDGYCSRAEGRRIVPYHYYEPARDGECVVYSRQEGARAGAHRFVTEKTVFGRWAARGNIRYSHPQWPRFTAPSSSSSSPLSVHLLVILLVIRLLLVS